jgi:hypothetical protein
VGGTGIDVANSLALDGSSNVYVTGYFNSTADFDPSSSTDNLVSAGGTDIFFAKYDASGNYIWSKGMGGTSTDQGYSLALDGSGNVFVTGIFYGTADFDPGSSTVNLVSGGNLDVFVAKYDASGSYVWANRIGASGNDYGTSLVLDGSNVVVTGYFSGTVDFDPSSTATANLTSAGSNDMFVAKYDASGNYLWAKGMGGTDNDQGLSLALDGSGNVLVTGKFSGTADFDPSAGTANLVAGTGTNNGFISSYTIASGTYNSALLLGGYTLATSVQSNAIVKDDKGNIYLTGYFGGTVDFDPSSTATANLTSAGGNDIFIAKYDASGNYAWAKGMGGTSTDVGNSLALDNSGNVFVTGSFFSTADFDPSSSTANLVSAGAANVFLAKYDASGNYVWAKRLGGTFFDAANSLTLDGSGSVYVTGFFSNTVDFDPSSGTANLVSAGNFDIFVSKYDASGNYIWAKGMGGTGADRGHSLALDGSGNLFVTGYFNSTADFDPSSSTANLVSAGSDDIFVAKYDASGNYVWAKGMGGTAGDRGHSLALDGSGNVFVTGFFNGTADFDPSSSTANLESAGSDDIFVAKYDASGNYVWSKGVGGTGIDVANSLALDGSSNVYVTGYFNSTADFDPSSSTDNLVSAGGTDIFFAKYDASGNYVWAQGMGGTGEDIGYSLALGGSGNVFVTGFFNTTADFDPSSSTYDLTSMSGSFGFFAAYVTCSNPTSGGTIATAQSGTSPFNPASFTSTVAASGESGTLEYKWQSSITSNSADFSDIASSNTETYDAGALTQTTWFKRLARVSCSADWMGAVASNVLEVTVSAGVPKISGQIGWRTDPMVGITNTSVVLSGDGTGTVTTLSDGLYSFDVSGSNYTVTPTKTTGKLNGVTALDVTRIAQHVGGTLPFTNPLDFIAADVNKSNTLNTSDVSTVQNALLNNPISLSQFKSSWRFVPTNTMFSTPYGTGAFWSFAEKRTYTGISTSQTDQDFVAVKVGDLVTPNFNPALKPAPAVPVVFAVPDVALTAGAMVEVPFSCDHFEDLVALQACFWFNPEVMALDAVLPLANMPMQVSNFGTWNLAEGRLPLVWAVATAETKVGNPELFKLRFRVLQGGYSLGDVLSISQKDMEASAWHADYRPERVVLAYSPVTEAQQRGETSEEGLDFELYQNEPNPFEDKTVIGFRLPAAASATLTVYDAAGRVVFTQQGDYAKGYNVMVLDRSLLKTSGVLYYTLATATASATKKMVQMK